MYAILIHWTLSSQLSFEVKDDGLHFHDLFMDSQLNLGFQCSSTFRRGHFQMADQLWIVVASLSFFFSSFNSVHPLASKVAIYSQMMIQQNCQSRGLVSQLLLLHSFMLTFNLLTTGILQVMSYWVKSFLIIHRLSKNIWKNKNQVYVNLFNFMSVRHKYWSRNITKKVLQVHKIMLLYNK